jgi:hypothetical protein
LCETATPSARSRNAASSRLDQCDNPVSGGGLDRVSARIRARTSAGTRAGRTIFTGLSSNPATPSAAKRLSAASTVGRDTRARAATSFFKQPSERHNTIRARVAARADTVLLFSIASSAARSDSLSSTMLVKRRKDC